MKMRKNKMHNLNTSYVDIKQCDYNVNLQLFLYLNTSYVDIKPIYQGK